MTTKVYSAPFSPVAQIINQQPSIDYENENNVIGWMPRPRVSFDCSPGLEYVAELNHVIIHQKFDLLQYGFEGATEFVVKTDKELQLYNGKEESKFWKRELFRGYRPMTFKLTDESSQEVIVFKRPLRGDGICCAGWERCRQYIEVNGRHGKQIGFVKQVQGGKNVKFHILNAVGDVVCQLVAPPNKWCNEFSEFAITMADGSTVIGKIFKKWLGPSGNSTMRSDVIIVNFPVDLDVNTKATLLTAGFMIVFLYIEQRRIYLEQTYRY